MKILPIFFTILLVFSCSPSQHPVPVFISSSDRLVPFSDSLMAWYSIWSGQQTVCSLTVTTNEGLLIRIGSVKPEYHELIGWMQTESGKRLPLEIGSTNRSDLAFFKTNFVGNRLIGLGWTLPEDPVYQITID